MSTPTPQEQTTLQRKSELRSDIQTVRGQIEDGLAMGDSMFGQFAHAHVTREVTDRLNQLKKQKEALEEDIRQKEALLERSNRDFSDVKETLPETQEQKRIRFMEDYTVMFLLLSYLFMALSWIVYRVMLSPLPWTSTLFPSLAYTTGGTILVALVLYVIV